MKIKIRTIVSLVFFGLFISTGTAQAQTEKPNIVVIMGNDIGMWNIGAYHRGMMYGRTPNIDQLAKTAIEYPPMQAAASFNIDAVKKKIQEAQAAHAQ